jgi:hypothetical protein
MDVTASKAGLAAWEQANGVTLMSADEIYAYDSEKYKLSLEGAPWKKEYASQCSTRVAFCCFLHSCDSKLTDFTDLQSPPLQEGENFRRCSAEDGSLVFSSFSLLTWLHY